ncbi:MAG: hypothetical protein IPH76_07110 [Xanthomonadales bacterium]|nr:hypothetical protein [Xanthomonadales bacterium]
MPPAIVQDGVTQFDSAAICPTLAEPHREAMLAVFEGESGRAEFRVGTSSQRARWMRRPIRSWSIQDVPARSGRARGLDPAPDGTWPRGSAHARNRDWVCGLFTIADTVLGHGLESQRRCDANFAEFPALAAYHARLKAPARPPALFHAEAGAVNTLAHTRPLGFNHPG